MEICEKYPKDFSKWHKLKSNIEHLEPTRLFRIREIWWCSLGANIGSEEDGKNELFERPILILRKFNKDIFLGIPLTSKNKKGIYYVPILIRGEVGMVIISQARTLSAKRLIRKIGKIGGQQFKEIRDSVIKITFTDKEK